MDTSTKKKVLVVDDDDNLRKVLLDQLEASGFVPLGAANGEEGVAKAIEWHPDVIMLDVLMPKMTGWQVLEKLRADDWGKTVKIIMLTSLGEIQNIAHALDKKVTTYIVKSDLNLPQLPELIRNMFK